MGISVHHCTSTMMNITKLCLAAVLLLAVAEAARPSQPARPPPPPTSGVAGVTCSESRAKNGKEQECTMFGKPCKWIYDIKCMKWMCVSIRECPAAFMSMKVVNSICKFNTINNVIHRNKPVWFFLGFQPWFQFCGRMPCCLCPKLCEPCKQVFPYKPAIKG